MASTSACACQRWTTSWRGWPKRLRWPAETTANRGATAATTARWSCHRCHDAAPAPHPPSARPETPAAASARPAGRCHPAAGPRRGGWRCAARSCLRSRPDGCPAPGAGPGNLPRPTASAARGGRTWRQRWCCPAAPAAAVRQLPSQAGQAAGVIQMVMAEHHLPGGAWPSARRAGTRMRSLPSPPVGGLRRTRVRAALYAPAPLCPAHIVHQQLQFPSAGACRAGHSGRHSSRPARPPPAPRGSSHQNTPPMPPVRPSARLGQPPHGLRVQRQWLRACQLSSNSQAAARQDQRPAPSCSACSPVPSNDNGTTSNVHHGMIGRLTSG